MELDAPLPDLRRQAVQHVLGKGDEERQGAEQRQEPEWPEQLGPVLEVARGKEVARHLTWVRDDVADDLAGTLAVRRVTVDERARSVVEVRDHDPDREGEVGKCESGEDEVLPRTLADGEVDPHEGEHQGHFLLAQGGEHEEGDGAQPAVPPRE